jgi:hypothetical protein
MKKIKIIAGITWAFICLILMLILFPGLNSFSASLAKLPFMKINPNYSGGEVTRQMISAGCTLDIRKPVFDGLLGERKNGFVQIDWRGNVPDKISDTVDYNLDGITDFCIIIDRLKSKADLTGISDKVGDISVSTPTSYGWAARIEVKK